MSTYTINYISLRTDVDGSYVTYEPSATIRLLNCTTQFLTNHCAILKAPKYIPASKALVPEYARTTPVSRICLTYFVVFAASPFSVISVSPTDVSSSSGSSLLSTRARLTTSSPSFRRMMRTP